MKLKHIQNTINNEEGIIAIILAICFLAFTGFMGFAVDLGIIYTAKLQLRNAADAAAIAGAAELVVDLDGDNIGEINYNASEDKAILYTEANELLSEQLIWGQNDFFEAGKWDKDLKEIVIVPQSTDPNDFSAVRISLSRSVPTYFFQFFGIHEVDMTARATAFVDCAGDGTQVDLPIAVNKIKLVTPLEEIIFSSEQEENGQWTSFDNWSCNKNSIEPYILGSENNGIDPPKMNIGDEIYMNNGEIASLYPTLKDRFNNEKDENNEYHVILAVVSWAPPQNRGTLVGFVNFIITEVNDNSGPSGKKKTIYGYMDDTIAISPGSLPGGGCYGVRTLSPSIVR